MLRKIAQKNSLKLIRQISQQEISKKYPGDPLNQLRQKLISQKEEENFDNYTKNFFKYLKLTRDQKNMVQKEYPQNNVFYNNLNLKMIRNTKYFLQTKMIGMFTAGVYVVFSYHFLLGFIPIVALVNPYKQYQFISQFLKKFIYKIELSTDEKTILLHLGDNTDAIVCQINKLDLQDIIPIDANFQQEICTEKHENNLESFMLSLDVVDTFEQKHENLRLIIQPNLTYIKNIDLLHHILNGETQQVQKFNQI